MKQRLSNIRINKRNFKKYILPAVAILVVGYLALTYFNDTSANTLATSNTGERIKIADAVATTQITRPFSFPIKDNEGNEVSQFTVNVLNAELRDEIIVQGKRATSVEGRTFLVVNLEIKNDYDRSIQINTRDYFRLTMNGNEDNKFAPDVHNDPVDVQAISTKPTRIAFPVNDTDNSFVLHVGEISGTKERVELNLQYR